MCVSYVESKNEPFSERYFGKNWKILTRAKSEKSPRDFMPKMNKVRWKTKKWLGVIFWLNWLKMAKLKPLLRSEHVRYFQEYVHFKIAS
jgi:hypothetical protein